MYGMCCCITSPLLAQIDGVISITLNLRPVGSIGWPPTPASRDFSLTFVGHMYDAHTVVVWCLDETSLIRLNRPPLED